MKELIKGLPSRSIAVFFGALYLVALLLAIFPPFYLASSRVETEIAGIPFAIAYWILDALLVGFGLLGLYVVEDIRGELDEEAAA